MSRSSRRVSHLGPNQALALPRKREREHGVARSRPPRTVGGAGVTRERVGYAVALVRVHATADAWSVSRLRVLARDEIPKLAEIPPACITHREEVGVDARMFEQPAALEWRRAANALT